jgi:hypothetical protein
MRVNALALGVLLLLPQSVSALSYKSQWSPKAGHSVTMEDVECRSSAKDSPIEQAKPECTKTISSVKTVKADPQGVRYLVTVLETSVVGERTPNQMSETAMKAMTGFSLDVLADADGIPVSWINRKEVLPKLLNVFIDDAVAQRGLQGEVAQKAAELARAQFEGMDDQGLLLMFAGGLFAMNRLNGIEIEDGKPIMFQEDMPFPLVPGVTVKLNNELQLDRVDQKTGRVHLSLTAQTDEESLQKAVVAFVSSMAARVGKLPENIEAEIGTIEFQNSSEVLYELDKATGEMLVVDSLNNTRVTVGGNSTVTKAHSRMRISPAK